MLVSSVYAIFLLAAIPSYHSNWKALNLRVGQGTMWIHITSGLLAKRKFPEFQHLSTRNTALRLHWHANKICYKELSLTSSLEYNSLDEHVLNILKNAFLFHSKTCNNQDVIKSINISMELICRLILTAITSGISIIKTKDVSVYVVLMGNPWALQSSLDEWIMLVKTSSGWHLTNPQCLNLLFYILAR